MSAALLGKRILVVEDEYFIAVEVRRALRAAGADVLGPVGTLAAGLRLAEDALDGAVLDVNLAEQMAYPIAERLASQGTPYLFLTGYDGASLPPAHRGAACLAKPFATESLVSTLAGLLATGP